MSLAYPPESHWNLVVTRDRTRLDEATALIDKFAKREALWPALGIIDRAEVQRQRNASRGTGPQTNQNQPYREWRALMSERAGGNNYCTGKSLCAAAHGIG